MLPETDVGKSVRLWGRIRDGWLSKDPIMILYRYSTKNTKQSAEGAQLFDAFRLACGQIGNVPAEEFCQPNRRLYDWNDQAVRAPNPGRSHPSSAREKAMHKSFRRIESYRGEPSIRRCGDFL